MAGSESNEATGASAEVAGSDVPKSIVVDLGKRKRKDVKRLRKGSGKLMARIDDLLGEMRSGGTLEAGARTVIVVVEKKSSKMFRW